MTRMTGPDCAVMYSLISTRTHTHILTHRYTLTHRICKESYSPSCGFLSDAFVMDPPFGGADQQVARSGQLEKKARLYGCAQLKTIHTCARRVWGLR